MSAPDAPKVAPSESSVALGASLQRYTLDAKIASGGIATVYRGRGVGALGFERPVAIKVCHPHLVDGPGRAAAFLAEARVAARIRHPHVVSTLDVVAEGGAVSIVMEYVEGRTVAELIRAAGRNDSPVPVGVAARIVADALLGLHAAHELRDDDGRPMDLVHRDVSPQNILVSTDGFAKVADFGVFKARGREAPSTEVGSLKGKLGYVAPEVYQGRSPITRAADVYAAGVVLWEIVAGRRLFGDDSHAGVMRAVLAGEVPPLMTLRSDVPAALDAVVARALSVAPELRYETADAFARALEPFAVAAREVAASVRACEGEKAPSTAPSVAHRDVALRDETTPHEYVTPVVNKAVDRTSVRIVAALAAIVFVGAFAMTRAWVTSAGGREEAPRTSVDATTVTTEITNAVLPAPTSSVSAVSVATVAPPPTSASAGPAVLVRAPSPRATATDTKVAPRTAPALKPTPRASATVFDPEAP